MRSALLVSVLVLTVALSGCGSTSNGSSSTDPTTDDCTGDCPTPTTSGTPPSTPPTSRPPNVPPVISIKVTDANGTATNVTFAGGTLTFDASASTDPDDGLGAIAISVQDSNKTFDPQLLYADGEFATASYTFDRAGVVNVTVSGIDKSGDVSTLETHVFVNSRQIVGANYLFTGAVPDTVASAKTCKGSADNAAVDNLVWTANTFDVQNSTTYVTATVLAPGKGEIALCAPDGTALSDESTTMVTSNPDAVFVDAAGASGYFVSVYSGAPNQKVPIEVVVHYEPQA